MKIIQWFPGHMTKAVRMMEENISLCDGVLYVLDARCPMASINPKMKKLFGEKPVLYILNKADLADPKETEAFIRLLEKQGASAVAITASSPPTKRILTARLAKITEEKRQKFAAKGMQRTMRFMVAGVPNTGKSTVINTLAGEKRAQTGDKAGVTKAKQWIRGDGFELLDTPGTMPPAFENQDLARHLAYVGSINDDILDFDDIALCLLSELAARHPQLLAARYGITDYASPLGMYEARCKRRGFIVSGGEYDYERGAKALIDDFRKGRIGRISLECAKDFAQLENPEQPAQSEQSE